MFRDTPQYKEVHPTKNNIDEIEKIKKLRKFSNKKIWWICDKSSCVHEWEATIYTRTGKRQSGCPICANKKICPCEKKCNSFGNKNSDIASEWHITKNGEKTPYDFAPGSHEKIWWICDKKKCMHMWKTSINSRTSSNKRGCPFCAGCAICPCENKCNSFGCKYPDIASEWHIINGKKTPYDYTPGSHERVWWRCDKSQCMHMWKASINHRTSSNKTGCPYCVGRVICPFENKCNSFGSLYPDIANEWHIKNKKTPYDYTSKSGKNVWWKCSLNHEWKTSIAHRTVNETGCPNCNESKGEKLIAKILESWNITYNIQKKFEKCKYKRKLKFDFYIPSLNTCIEYDGKQHYIRVNYFHKNKERFHQQKIKDDIKSIYCQTNNIKLLRVNYMQTESEINNCIRRLILFGIYNVF